MSLFAASFLVFCSLSIAAAVFACLYHLALMAAAPFCKSDKVERGSSSSCTFAIVIPACNEEGTIESALSSLAAFEYPRDKFNIYVIADNCGDRTAEIAAGLGAICLIREDANKRGKGFALEWALPRVLAAGHDAILVLDADCRIDAHALNALDDRFSRGDMAVQLNNVVGNSDDSPISYVLAVANRLENDYFYVPKSRLGLAVLLRGTGMAFHRHVLETIPWRCCSVTEDVEYGLQLLDRGVRVVFLNCASVWSPFPVSQKQLDVQRSRWVGGGMTLARTQAFRMLARGIARRNALVADAGLSLLLLSRPLIILQLAFSVGLCFIGHFLHPSAVSVALVLVSVATVCAYCAYASVGLISLGLNTRRLRLFFAIPGVIARYMAIGIKAGIRAPSDWLRTPRLINTE